MDLGIVKEAGEETGSTSLALGTPRYMAPEVLENAPLDARADLYALGVVGYHALAGEPPFDGLTPMAILYKQAHEPPPSLAKRAPRAPENLISAIEMVLEKKPEARFQSAGELLLAETTIVHVKEVCPSLYQ